MTGQYYCTKCNRKFVDWGAEKLDYKRPNKGCEQAPLVSGYLSTTNLPGQNPTTTENTSPLIEEWETSYRIKKGINTSSMEEKGDYLRTIVNHFPGGKIPLDVICNTQKRRDLSIFLFSNDNERNFIRYVISMGQHLRKLTYEGDYLVMRHP